MKNKEIKTYQVIIENQAKYIDFLLEDISRYRQENKKSEECINYLLKKIEALQSKKTETSKHSKDAWDVLANAIVEAMIYNEDDEDD